MPGDGLFLAGSPASPDMVVMTSGVLVARGLSGLRRWAGIAGRWADLWEAGHPCCYGIGARCFLGARRPVAGGGFLGLWLVNRGGWAVLKGSWPALVAAVAGEMRQIL